MTNPIKRVFCWKPTKVRESVFQEGSHRWLVCAWVNGDGRHYNCYAAAEAAAAHRTLKITVGSCDRFELTAVGAGGGGSGPRIPTVIGAGGSGPNGASNFSHCVGAAPAPDILAPENVELAIGKVLNGNGDVWSRQAALVAIIRKLANGMEV